MRTALFLATLALVACGAPSISQQSQQLDNNPRSTVSTSIGHAVPPAPPLECHADSDCPNGFVCPADPCAPPKMCPVALKRYCAPKPAPCESNCDCPVNSFCSVPAPLPACACPVGAACFCPPPPPCPSCPVGSTACACPPQPAPGVCVAIPVPVPIGVGVDAGSPTPL